MVDKSWTDGVSGGGALNLDVVELFSLEASSVYYDDFVLERGPDPNTPPDITNPVPENDSWMNTDNITEQFNITVNDTDGDTMNITWWTNASGSWVQFNETLNVNNGTYNATNLSWIDDCNITCYWSVNVTDGNAWNNSTFHFDVECKITRLRITARTIITDVIEIADAVSSVIGIILVIFAVMGIVTIVSKVGQ